MSSRQTRNTHGTPAALAPDGCTIATVNGSLLSITQLSNGEIIRSVPLHEHVRARLKFFQWSKSSSQPLLDGSIPGAKSHRIICASGNHISVLDAYDEDFSAEIDAGEGTNLVHVDFTTSPTEVLALSEFGVQLTIFLLDEGEQRVIKSPKFANPSTYALRPNTGHLACILKIDSGDVLTVHERGSYEAITTTSIPAIDAQGLKWSPNGTWLAVWETASVGTKVIIYTADGQQFRTYSKEQTDFDFGVRTVEWSPDSRLLAVGKHDGTIDLLNGATFTLLHTLDDPTTTRPIGRDVYIERQSNQLEGREYALTPESPVFPFTYNTPSGSRIVSTISFNPSGSLMASVDQGLPNIVWMWSLQGQKPLLAGALVQKFNVRQLLWNQDLPDLLMTTSEDDTLSLHQWICGHVPRIASITQATGGRHNVSWIRAGDDSSGLIFVGSQSGYVLGYVTGSGLSTTFNPIFCLEDGYPAINKEDFPYT